MALTMSKSNLFYNLNGVVTMSMVQCRLHGVLNRKDTADQPYNIYGGLVIERRPVLTAAMNTIEKKYFKLQAYKDLKKSSYSRQELRHQADLELAKRRMEADFDEADAPGSLVTAQDVEDMWAEEMNKFQSSPTLTEADQNGTLHTNQRCLNRSLYLLVKQKFDSNAKGVWVFPQALSSDGKSIKETCEQVVATLSDDLKVTFLGNTPFAFYKKKYPERFTRDGSACGAKVFLCKSLLINGDVTQLTQDVKNIYNDFCWVTSDEAKKMLDKRYYSSIKPLLDTC